MWLEPSLLVEVDPVLKYAREVTDDTLPGLLDAECSKMGLEIVFRSAKN
jgi:hypothetical protein